MESKPQQTRVMLVDDNPARSAMVEASLTGCGYLVVAQLATASGLLYQIEQHRPDVIIIDIDSPDRDVLESLTVANTFNPTPVVMFSHQEDAEFINQAVSAGVTAYQMDGLNPTRVKPVIDVAIAQFAAFQSLRRELEESRGKLEARKTIERAKGLLMSQGMAEDEAHKTLQRIAMDNNQTIVDVARNVIALLTNSKEKPKASKADLPTPPKKEL